MAHPLALLEDEKALSLYVDFCISTEPQLQRKVFEITNYVMRTFLIIFFYYICLQISQFGEAGFRTFNHEISRLLQRHGIFALLHLNFF